MLLLLTIFFRSLILCHLIASASFAAADLEITNLRGVLSSERKAYTLTFRVSNEGPADAKSVGCNVYVFSNQTLLVSQNASVEPLAKGQSREESIEIALPSDPVTSIQVEVYDGAEADTQPSTNTASLHLKTGNVKKVDLQIVQAQIENEQPVGQKNLLLNIKLRNNGPDISAFSRLTAELVVLNESIVRTDRRIERLAVGDELDLKLPLTLTPSMVSNTGTVQIHWAILDAGSLDTSEDNNRLLIPVALLPRMPDLVTREIRADRNGVLRFVIINKGNSRSQESTTALYINGALVERYVTPGLAPNGTRAFQYAGGRLPRDTNVLVVVDFNADVQEFSEENNRLAYRTK